MQTPHLVCPQCGREIKQGEFYCPDHLIAVRVPTADEKRKAKADLVSNQGAYELLQESVITRQAIELNQQQRPNTPLPAPQPDRTQQSHLGLVDDGNGNLSPPHSWSWLVNVLYAFIVATLTFLLVAAIANSDVLLDIANGWYYLAALLAGLTAAVIAFVLTLIFVNTWKQAKKYQQMYNDIKRHQQ